MLGDKEAAQDAVSDAYINLWNRMEDVPVENAQAFLCKGVRQRCSDVIKFRQREDIKFKGYQYSLNESDTLDNERFEEGQIEGLLMTEIMNIYEKQTPRRKEIFRLVYFERKTHREAAIALGIARLTVSNTIMDMLKILRNGAVDI